MNDTAASAARTRRGRLRLLGLALLFLGPPLFSLAYHRLGFEWRPAPELGGELIEPPVAVPLPPGERPVPWRLVVIAPAQCDAACREDAHALRQLHVALGRYAQDFERVYVGGELPPGIQPGARAVEDPDAALRAALQRAAAGRPLAFLLLDPGNYAVVRYGEDYEPRAVLEDLTRLARRVQRS